mgnify:FL=1
MIQQVNLYQDCLNHGPEKPAINQYISSLIAITLLLFFYSIYLFIDLNNTKDNLIISKQQLSDAETQVQLLQVKYPKQQINDLLKQEISRSRNTLSSLSQVIQLLSDKTSDQTQGFSRYFSALARQSISEVWLRKITINGQRDSLTLQGSTYNPDKIPVTLQKLRDEAVFQGKIFTRLNMAQAQDNNNQINFAVSTLSDFSEQDNHD